MRAQRVGLVLATKITIVTANKSQNEKFFV